MIQQGDRRNDYFAIRPDNNVGSFDGQRPANSSSVGLAANRILNTALLSGHPPAGTRIHSARAL
jgi:hypothetical protein